MEAQKDLEWLEKMYYVGALVPGPEQANFDWSGHCNTVCVCYAHMSSRGVWGHAPPENFLKTTHREMQSGVFWRTSDKIMFQST